VTLDLGLFQKYGSDLAAALTMTSSQDFADHQRMSADLNSKPSLITINNNPSSSALVSDHTPLSPVIRASSGHMSDQPIVSNRRSDLYDYRSGSGGTGTGSGSTTAPVITSSFRSPKLEARGNLAKKAQKMSHHPSTGKRHQRAADAAASTTGGRSQASDSVRNVSFFADMRLITVSRVASFLENLDMSEIQKWSEKSGRKEKLFEKSCGIFLVWEIGVFPAVVNVVIYVIERDAYS